MSPGSPRGLGLALALRADGVALEVIARALKVKTEQVEQMLAEAKDGSPVQHLGEGSLMVKRLLTDPPELCCPLSQQVMDHPVVAADGITYERSWVEECLKRIPDKSPMTGLEISSTVLHPNQQTKSSIVAFKEETVKQILSVAPQLVSREEASKLLKRGEDFVRPLLPDATAKKNLAMLLLLQLKLPGPGQSVAKEAVSLLADVKDIGVLQQAFLSIGESDLVALLPSFDEDTIRNLQRALLLSDVPRDLVNRELARRLAGCLEKERYMKSLSELWLLIEGSLKDGQKDWRQAAGCLMAARMGQLIFIIQLRHISSDVLREAARFLDDRKAALIFAEAFFKDDLGIQGSMHWPGRATARIFQELASRLSRDKVKERLCLLEKGHRIDEGHSGIRAALSKELGHVLSLGESGASDMEGLYIKVTLIEEKELPADVLGKLTLTFEQLEKVPARQLKILAQQLYRCGLRGAAEKVELFARCQMLQKQLEAHHLQPDFVLPRLEKGAALVWDLSGYKFEHFEKVQLSEKFQLAASGVVAWMEISPYSSKEGLAARIYLNVSRASQVKWTMRSSRGMTKNLEHDFTRELGLRREDVMPICELKGSLTVRLLSVHATGSTLRFE